MKLGSRVMTKVRMPQIKGILFYVISHFLVWTNVQGQTQSITGRVIEQSTKKPLLGALVSLSTPIKVHGSDPLAQTITDADGAFSFRIESSGHYLIEVQHLGYHTVRHRLTGEDDNLVLRLDEATLPLKEVVIHSMRTPQTAGETALPIGILSRNDWQRSMPTDLPSALGKMPGVTLSADGIWSRSVQVRGLGEDRYVTMIDGNRIETATDLAAALSLIDMDDVQQVEVIKGGLSSLYGSGALGGVINVVTRRAEYSDTPYIRGDATLEYHGVNRLWSPSASISTGHQIWNARVHVGYRNADDAQSPDGPIVNSAYEDYNISAKAAMRPLPNHEIQVSYEQFRATAGIPGGGVLPPPAQATYRDADRDLFSLQYIWTGPAPWLQDLKIRYFRQSVFRNVEIRPNVPPRGDAISQIRPLLLNPSASHRTQGLLLEGRWRLDSRQELVIGLDAWQRRLQSERTRQILSEQLDQAGNPTSSTMIVRGEIPIPNSLFQSAGWFAQYTLALHPKWKLDAGGRFDLIRLSNEVSRDPEYLIRDGRRTDNPPGQIIVYPVQTSEEFTWALHGSLLFQPTKAIDITASAGRSYRAPSLEERYKYIDLGNAVELGNPDLVPEKGTFFNTGLKINTENLSLSVNAYANILNDMITMAPADSVAFLLNDGGAQMDKVFARRYQNISKALLAGFDAGANWLPYPGGMLYGTVSFTYGSDRISGQPLPFIAPLNGTMGMRQRLWKFGSLDATTRLFARQDRISDGEVATPGYMLVDVYFQSKSVGFGAVHLQMSAGVDNLLDVRYRNHLATNRGLWTIEPGRNVKCRLSVSW